MKLHLFRTVAVLISCFSLSGCQGLIDQSRNALQAMQRKADDGCKMSFKSHGGWSISGVVIPTTKSPTGSTVQIGSIAYNPDEAYVLTETAQSLEQVRLSTCAIINSSAFASMSDIYKTAGFNRAFDAVNNMTNFGESVKAAKNPSEALVAANKAKEEAKQAVEKARENQTAELRMISNLSERLATSANAASEHAKQTDTAIDEIRGAILTWQSQPQSSKIEIVGFPKDATNLPAGTRDQLIARVRGALTAIPAQQGAVIVVIGYADKSGNYARNVELGLRRAQIVISYLQQQQFGRSFQARAASGGIDETLNGRHVAIIVSGTA